ncbi:hypothetical protein NEOLI_004825 [Neolecta irregularis DAH-3]|uniref:CCHC-type domain-containing protein n=1 Tax=Neolecta irregularis (strain DAH-3) TaxID=1198029 RepID=A0A1U7LKG2_NEOID|nr:hypothetical protein NEOLI_004825 [Neolecta irregularis DAH-3]|eukprot:OLL23011.1 hypothetical protein NEOLI_004825 [Neolecta irregularis DAH-3]
MVTALDAAKGKVKPEGDIDWGNSPIISINHRAIPVFSGTSANTWLFIVKRIVSARQRKKSQEDDDIFDDILCSLSGAATKWFQTNETKIKSLDEFFTLFAENYIEESDISITKVQFWNSKQGNRTVKEFADEFRNLWRKIGPNYCSEEFAIKKFADGLHPAIYTQCIPEIIHCKSLNTFVAIAMLMESDIAATAAAQHNRGYPQTSERAKQRQNGECFQCGMRGHIARDCIKTTKKKPGSSNAIGYVF